MIEFQNVFKKYHPSSWAVEDVSFSAPKGKITCLIGPSGCGKTTLLRMVNRLIPPSEGEIVVNGEPVMSKDPIALRRSIGYVIQQGGLLPHLTVRDNISILLRVLKCESAELQERTREAMERVNLDPATFSCRFPSELSGGQQQRVVIARALVTDPQLLLMDEPFGALDPITRRSLRDECIEINRSLQKTLLLVTHDLDEAFELGDRIVLMNKGKVEQAGTKEALMESPKSPFVEEFIHTHLAKRRKG